MARRVNKEIQLTSYEDLLGVEENEVLSDQIMELPISELHDFKNHPFQVREDDEMEKLSESVKEYGVLNPALARPKVDGGYELISGHRRKLASIRSHRETMLVIVRDYSDDETVAYTEYESDLRYQKFTINEDTLVKPVAETQTGRVFSESMDEKGFFISRVPGTKGADLNYLVVPKEQVFWSDDKKTYTAFLEKAEKPIVMDRNFNIISGEKRKYAEELFNSHYNLSEKEQNITQSIRNNLPNRTANKLKAPAVPMKVK